MSKQNTTKPLVNNSLNQANFYDSYLKGKELYYLLGIVFAVSYFVFTDFINLKKVYLFRDIGSDSLNIYFPGLAFMSDYLKSEGVPGWSFEQGMGQNMFPFWFSDLFSDFLVLFDKSKIPRSQIFFSSITIIRLLFSKLRSFKRGNFEAK